MTKTGLGEDASQAGTLTISSKLVALIVTSAIGFVLAMHLLLMVLEHGYGNSYAWGLASVFNLDSEGNIPALTASLLILFCGLSALITGVVQPLSKRDRFAWTYFGCLLLFLAYDEGAHLHEALGNFMNIYLDYDWIPYYAFIVPYGILALVTAVILAPWYLRLDRKTQIIFATAGTIYLTGAAGFELISIKYFESIDPTHTIRQSPVGDIFITIEETCEFCGMGLLLYTLINRIGGIRISAGNESQARVEENLLLSKKITKVKTAA